MHKVLKTHKNPKADAAEPVKKAMTAQQQLEAFEGAMRLFHARHLQEACDLFKEAASGPKRDVADRARLYLRMCEQRLNPPAPRPEDSPD